MSCHVICLIFTRKLEHVVRPTAFEAVRVGRLVLRLANLGRVVIRLTDYLRRSLD